MKKNIFCIGLLSLFVACNTNDDDSCNPDNDSREIKLRAGVEATKAPISSGFSTDFPIGVYAHNPSWQSGTSANLINNDNATVAGAAGHNITFGSGPYYYPADGTDANFFAFAPRGTELTPAGAGTSPVVTISMTGQEDIMWATATGHKSGSAAAVPPILNFAHKLTQLQFTFVAAANYPTTSKVVGLTVNAQPNLATMTVETGACTFSGSADMQALSSANIAAGIAIVATPGTNANSPVMTTSSASYTLTVTVKPVTGSNVTYSNVPITTGSSGTIPTPIAGTSYMITLTFSTTAITATATVADWVAGTGGGVSIL